MAPIRESNSTPNDSRGYRVEVRAHVEKHLGRISQVFGTEEVGGPQIDVLHVSSEEARPVNTLVTAGMSDRPMAIPLGEDAPRYLELMMTLPQSWRFDEQSQQEEKWNWPVRLLASIARIPQLSNSWLGWGHVVPNGAPPRPLAPNTKLCGAVIVPSLLVPQDFYEISISAHSIAIFSLLPLYKEEMDLQAANGVNHLFETLIDAGIKDFVDVKRRNVAKKRFGWF